MTVETGSGESPRMRPIAAVGFVVASLYVYVLLALAAIAIVLPVIVGMSAFVISSGSMSPALSVGDILVASEPSIASVAPGSVVVFENPVNLDTWVTHRVVGSNADGSFISQGDANLQRDSTPVHIDQIAGVGRIVVPYIGLPAHWFAQGRFVPLGLWTVVTLLSMIFMRMFARNHRTSDDEADGGSQNGGYHDTDLVVELDVDDRVRVRAVDKAPVSLAAKIGQHATTLLVFVSSLVLIIATTAPTHAAFSDSTVNSGNSLAAAASFDSIEFVQTVDTVVCGGSSSILVVPPGGIPSGDTLLVRIALSGARADSTVAASDGVNSYVVDADMARRNRVRVVVIRGYIDVALQGGDLITVSHPDVRAESVTADQFSGLADAPPIALGTGSGRSATPTADTATSGGESILYGAVANVRNVVHSEASGWSSISLIGSVCPRQLDNIAAYRVDATAGPIDYTTTLSRTTNWVEVLIVYAAG